MRSYNPPTARRRSLGCSLFARHYLGNHYCFLFLPVLRCFSSRGWLTLRCDWSSTSRVFPFGHLRILRLCAASRSFSQLTTSFIASQSLGIHRVPLVALKNLKLYCYPTTMILRPPFIFGVWLKIAIDYKLSFNFFSQYVKELSPDSITRNR